MIELELLAVVWAVTKKCHIYLQGQPFQLIVDHKPLIPILNKYTLDMVDNPRLQRLKEHLSWYQFKTTWKKGSEHYIPDALSRAPVANPEKGDCFFDEVEKSVSASVRATTLIISSAKLKDPYLAKLEQAAAADQEYQALITAVTEGFRPRERLGEHLRAFWKVRDALTVAAGGLVLHGARIVVPQALRKDVLAELHRSHQGIERTKRQARLSVFWPGINSDIKSTVEACEPCQLHLPSQQQETMLSADAEPTRPFEDTSADLFSHGNHKYLVFVDRYSGYPIVHSWRSDPSTQQVVDALIVDFSHFGVPLRLRTDGGPQFASAAFQKFLEEWNVAAGYSTPHYPQSNGHAEAAVKAMKALVQKSECKGKLSNPDFAAGLLAWRNTPKEHGCSPAQLVFGHSTRTTVPATEAALLSTGPVHDLAQQRQLLKEKAAANYNAHSSDLAPLQLGQQVRIQDTASKLWDKVGTIVCVAKHRSYKVKVDNGGLYWRNRKFLCLFHPPPAASALKPSVCPTTPPADVNVVDGAGQQHPTSPGRGRKGVRFQDQPPTRRSKRERKSPARFGVHPA
jgi:transposase InsO family protein